MTSGPRFSPHGRPISRQSTERERVKMILQDSFRRALRVKSCADLCDITRHLKQLYIDALDVPGGIERYLAALRFALELTCEKSTDKEGRINCLKMSAHVALALSQENMHEPLQLLVDFCVDNTCAIPTLFWRQGSTGRNDPLSKLFYGWRSKEFLQILLPKLFDVRRQRQLDNMLDQTWMGDLCMIVTRGYICALAGLLLNLNKLIANRLQEQNPRRADCSPLSNELRTSLFTVLSKRLLDVSPQVRSEALKAVAALQDDQSRMESYQRNSPKRLLIAHLNDVSYECRIVAVKKLLLSSTEEVDLVMNMALSDSEERVRRAAIIRIIKDVSLKALSIKQRMDLVQGVMNMSARSPNQGTILNDLLGGWLKTACGKETLPESEEELSSFYCIASSHLLRFLEPLTQEQVSHDLVLHSLHYCRDKMGLGSVEVQEFVKTINRTAEDISLHRHNCNKLIEESWTALEQANAVFYWRCLLDFCKSKCVTDADWSECHYRLLPTMRTFCELMQSYSTTALMGDETEALFALKMFTVMQLLKMIALFDQGDPAGWKSWRLFCENILSNMQLKLSTSLVNELVQQMFTHLWPHPELSDEALSSLCDLTSSIVHKAVFPNATMLAANQTIGIGGNETAVECENMDVDDDAMHRCIMIVSAMLKTNRYRKMNTFLHGVLENIIERCVVSADVNCRILAFEAMGILAMYDRRVAFEKTILIKETLKIDQRLRPTMLNILCNMSLLHGYPLVARWFGGLDSTAPSDDLLQVFGEYIDSLDPETSFTACECLCKMFLKEANLAWIGILSRLLLKAFDPGTNNNPKLKACLVTFIPVFAEWSREHQMLLVEAFPETFDALRSDEQFVGALTRVNVAAVGACFVHATSLQLLNGADKEKGSVHPFLCQKILAALGDDPEDDYAPVYCKMLSDIDASDWNDAAQINALITDTDDVIDLYSDTEETRGYIRALTSFSRKLRKRADALAALVSTRKHGESESVSDRGDCEVLKISKPVLRESSEGNGCKSKQVKRKQADAKPKSSNSKPKVPKAKTASCDVKALLREDIEDQNEENEAESDENGEASKSKPKLAAPAPSPAVQRRRPVLARAAKDTLKILKEEESSDEEDEVEL